LSQGPTVSNPPISYFENNLFLSEKGEWRAGFWLPSYHFDFRSEEELLFLSDRWEELCWNLQDEAHLLMVPRKLNVTAHIDRIKSRVIEPLKEYGEAYYERVLNYMKKEAASGKERETFTYDFYLLIRLKESPVHLNSFGEQFKFRLKDLKRSIDSLSGLTQTEILEEELTNYRHQEETTLRWLQREIFDSRVRRMTGDEAAYLIKRGFWRGIREPQPIQGYRTRPRKVQQGSSTAIRPKKSDVLRLTGGLPDDSHGRYLINRQFVPGENGEKGGMKEGFMTFLSVSHIPDDRPVPGTDWLYWLQDLEFPVEVSVRLVPIDSQKALRRVRNKKKELDDQEDHLEQHGSGSPRPLREALEKTDELEGELTEHMPLVDTSVNICVFADSRNGMESRVGDVMSIYTGQVFNIDIAYGNQLELFCEFMPGSSLYLEDFQQTLDPTMVSGAFFGATRSLGDRDGIFAGRSKHQDVLIDFTRGTDLSLPPACAFVGPTGKGKTMAADAFSLENVMLGAQLLAIDPKNDRGHWVRFFPPEWRQLMNLVQLKAEEADRGKLDPLAGRGRKGVATAQKILQILAAVPDGSYFATAIGEAVQDTLEEAEKSEKTPTMVRVLELLHQHYDERIKQNEDRTIETREKFYNMLYALDHHSQYGQGKLLFSDGTQDAVDLSHPITILQIQDLVLPDPDEQQQEGSRLGVALLVALADIAKAFADLPSDRFKICLFDEAWRMRKTQEGRDTLKSLIREGRSKNSALIPITQNANDLHLDDKGEEASEEVQNNLGMRVVFGPNTYKEAERVCELLKIEPSPHAKDKLTKLKPGEFFFYDWEGRVNIVHYPLKELHPDLFRILDSRPNKRSELLQSEREEEVKA